MPATGFEIDHDVKALLGDIPGALKAAEQELRQLEKQFAQIAAKGGQLDNAKLGRAADLKLSADRYRSILADERRARDIAKEEAAKLFAQNGVGANDNGGKRPKSSAPNVLSNSNLKQAAALRVTGPLTKQGSVADWVYNVTNTHNPHGALRAAVRGNVGTLASLGGKLFEGAKGLGGLAGTAAKLIFDLAQHQADGDLAAAGIDFRTVSGRSDVARSARFGSIDTEFLKAVRDAGSVGGSRANLGPAAALFVPNSYGANVRRFQQKREEFLHEFKNFNRSSVNIENLKNDPSVQRQFEWKAEGTFGKLWAETVGRFTGSTEAAKNEAAIKRGEQIMAEAERRRKVAATEFYQNNPNMTVSRTEAENRLNAFQQREFERFNDWNKI